MLLPVLVSAALAQDPGLADANLQAVLQETPPTTEPTPTPAPSTGAQARPYLMEVNLRGRYMGVPDSILDIWYYDTEDDGGQHPERPSLRAWSAGLEYVVKNRTNNGIFYFDYIGNLTPQGYWDDREDPADYTDGDYVVPDGIGLITVGANYAYELHATQWLSFMFGTGLGVLFVTGELQKWDSEDGKPSYQVYEERPTEPDDVIVIPRVLPMVDINAGVKFDINHRAGIRLEGGFHNALYGGAAVGIIF